MTDRFGVDLERILQDFARRLARLESAAKVRQGLIVGKASGAFNLPETGSAAQPDSGASLYHDGSTLRLIDSAGNDTPLGGVSQVSRPQYPASFQSENIGGTPTSAQYNALRADAAMLQVCLRDVINKGADVPLWPAG